MVAGHSFGELTALHAAGVLGPRSLSDLASLRGSLMAGNGEDRGTMLAVLAPLADIERVIADAKLDVVLANCNGPSQGVLAGTRAAIDVAEAACKAKNLRTARLAVGAAFHSPLVAGAAKAFREGLSAHPFGAPRVPVIANTTGDAYPEDASAARDLLGEQLAKPVRFDRVIERMADLGAHTFLEVGPRATLSGMVRAILGNKPHAAIATDAQGTRGGLFDLATALCRLAALGHPVDLAPWDDAPRPPRASTQPQRKPKMSIPLTGANHRDPFTPIPARAPNSMAHVAEGRATATKREASMSDPKNAPTTNAMIELLRANQAAVAALASQQEQTARIHQTFLEGQLHAQQSLHALLTGQRDLTQSVLGAEAVALPTLMRAAPPPAFAKADAVVVTPMPMPVPVRVEPVHEPAEDARAALFAVVAQTTGYPEETLEVSMDMEADLGIDSIKRVEILSLLSKRIKGAPSVNPEKLGALRTLQQVIDFIGVGAPAATPVAAPKPAREIAVDVVASLLEVVSQTTGYPKETLELGMDMEADLGIDSIKRVEILSLLSKRVPHAPSVNPEKLSALRTLQQVVDFIGAPASTATATPITTIAPTPTVSVPSELCRRVVFPVRLAPRGDAPLVFPSHEIAVQSGHPLSQALVTALTSLGARARLFSDATSVTSSVGGLVVFAPSGAAWTAAAEQALKGSLQLARAFGPRLCDAAAEGPAFFACVSVRDGAFGHACVTPAQNPLAGGVAGLAKTAAHEWPQVRCLAVDVAKSMSDEQAAREIANELGSARVPDLHEVGLGPAGRLTLGLVSAPATPLHRPLREGDVVVVTGGARGVTASCARELALATGAKLLLLGRSKLPADEPAWMAAAADEASLKRALLEHAPAGEKPTPKMLGEAARATLAAREIRQSLAQLAEHGVVAAYRSVDVRDEKALIEVLSEARATLGPIRGIVHGAGVLRDKRIEDKRDEDIDQVVDTKLAGLRALLLATRSDDLGVLALFASVSGRFGRRGQSDYALANQALVSIAQVEAAQRPRCRVVALDWGPWDGGMVTPALKHEFHREGVALLSLEDGARAMVTELMTAPGGPVEVVLGAGFGPSDVNDVADAFVLSRVYHLDPATYPILADHRLAGKAVLPFALSLEWLAAAMQRIQGSAGSLVLTDARVLRGLPLGAAPEDVSVWARATGDAFVLELRNAKDAVLVRATASVVEPTKMNSLAEPEPLLPHPLTVQRIYATQLFHGKSLEAITDVAGLSPQGMVLSLRTHRTSEALLPLPATEFVLGPLTLDGVFQALIVWCRNSRGAASLPSSIARLTQLRPFDDTGSVRAVVRIREVDGAVVTADVDLSDARGVALRIEGYVCTVSASLDRAFQADGKAGTSLSVTG
jgi:acyl transferase domain-containing protein